MDFDFSPVWGGWRELLHGAFVTIEITLGAIILGCLIGLVIGLGRLDPRRRVVYGLCTAYVSFIRGTPLLVQLFIWFFGLPHFGLNFPAFFCGIVGMGIYSGAYVSEIVRGAIQSIERGQMEAARSLGMPYRMAMREIVVPQAVVRMIPPLGNEFIALIKTTSLASIIGFSDLLRNAQDIYYTNAKVIELLMVAALWYLAVVSVLSVAQEVLERRFGRGFTSSAKR
jgi:polar amino acid transport system permease protein